MRVEDVDDDAASVRSLAPRQPLVEFRWALSAYPYP